MTAPANLLHEAARTGCVVAENGGRLCVDPTPPPRLAEKLLAARLELLPLLLPTTTSTWPEEWRDLLDERTAIDREFYQLDDETAAFVSEGWVRLAYARQAARYPAVGVPWADLAFDDLLTAANGSAFDGIA